MSKVSLSEQLLSKIKNLGVKESIASSVNNVNENDLMVSFYKDFNNVLKSLKIEKKDQDYILKLALEYGENIKKEEFKISQKIVKDSTDGLRNSFKL